jgi:hypothetical protein
MSYYQAKAKLTLADISIFGNECLSYFAMVYYPRYLFDAGALSSRNLHPMYWELLAMLP